MVIVHNNNPCNLLVMAIVPELFKKKRGVAGFRKVLYIHEGNDF